MMFASLSTEPDVWITASSYDQLLVSMNPVADPEILIITREIDPTAKVTIIDGRRCRECRGDLLANCPVR